MVKEKIEPTACQAVFTRVHVHVQVWEVFLCAWMVLAMLWGSQVSWFVVDILQYRLGFSLKIPDPKPHDNVKMQLSFKWTKEDFIPVGEKKAKPSKIQCKLKAPSPPPPLNFKLRWFVKKIIYILPPYWFVKIVLSMHLTRLGRWNSGWQGARSLPELYMLLWKGWAVGPGGSDQTSTTYTMEICTMACWASSLRGQF